MLLLSLPWPSLTNLPKSGLVSTVVKAFSIILQRTFSVTGASSGFGRSMTECCLRNGDKVVATLRKPEMIADLAAIWPKERLLVHQLDVTDKAQIIACFAAAKEHFGRVDVVFNNAGMAVIAEIEGMSEKLARQIFEVNFWGVANISREAVRFFREENKPCGGYLIQNSSSFAHEAGPSVGYYSAR